MDSARNVPDRGEAPVVAFQLPDELRRCHEEDDHDAPATGRRRRGDGDETSTMGGSRYELWCVQLLGDGLELQDLDGADCCVDIELSPAARDAPGGREDRPKDDVVRSTAISAPNDNTREYVIQLLPNSTPNEHGAGANDSMRLIGPAKRSRRKGARSSSGSSDSSSDSDDDDDDDNNKRARTDEEDDNDFSYQLCPQRFSRHCSIISHPRPAEQPSSKSGSSGLALMRKAYEPVPHRSGLKRRWVPFGGNCVVSSRPESSADRIAATETTTTSASTTAFHRAPRPDVDGDDTPHSTIEKLKADKWPPKQKQQQEAGQATAAMPGPQQQSASSATSELGVERSVDNAAASTKAKNKKAEKKEAKKAAKKEAKKKDKKRRREEGSSSS